ncbi:hypothetical protein HLRTI_001307 [Halorhabdus tiamatea SARL4B]|uniref:Conserved hypothetical membrane protein containing peptidase propeptide and YPEB domain n=1 Tax=Halorhabdus tiamatea SARL4B TaxID=1033806 RepID=S6D185_9EURY|nr:hypothetical protein [Halorhabdus tiamatea]ERJ06601.1 hypothetical protein HLRTI_001307 [Halorhabdus tiamatea SARL4B]CCQ32235.1 conserved hypothetical membrane protein containing peptidase propeptide and YPEB domain [Halorhabdus tiamatea SARL4B]
MRRVALLTLAVLALALAAGVAPAAAQAENETATGSEAVNASSVDTSQIVQELGTVTVHKVEFADDGLVRITVTATEHSGPIAVTDSGAVDIGSNERASVPFEVYRPGDGTHVLRFHLASDDALITIQEGGEMMAASGDRGTADVLSSAPTVQIVQWGVLSGGIGTTLSLGLAVGYLRRRHENTYKELTTQERIRVEEDAVEGVLGKARRFVSHHRYALLTAASVVAYLVAVRLGVLPSTGEVWAGLTDAQRVIAIGSGAMTVIMFVPVYALATRLWEPAKEYIVSFDITDALTVSAGSEGGVEEFLDDVREAETEEDIEEVVNGNDSVAISVYSGAPERVSDLDVVEGEPADVRSPGGQTHLVRQFDPKRNRATGTWPGTAHDALIAALKSAIDWNREVLEDESDAFRTLLGGVGAMRSASNSSAAVALNKQLAEATDIDPGPMDNILDRALASTRFSGYFTGGDDDGEEESYDEDVDGGDSAGDGDTVNDGGDE